MVTVDKNGARVLVVDDEPNITELVAMALRYEGFTVKTAATGRGALTAVSQFSPSLVILDVMLPDIDGMEVMKRLNSSGELRSIPGPPGKHRYAWSRPTTRVALSRDIISVMHDATHERDAMRVTKPPSEEDEPPRTRRRRSGKAR